MSFSRPSSQASSTPPPRFRSKRHFSRTAGQGGWYCTLCTSPGRAHLESMSGPAAMTHERTKAHARKVEEYESGNWKPDVSGWEPDHTPYADLRKWDGKSHVDRLRDLIPFWRDGVLAAERGEEAGRMEEFLERLEEEWNNSNGWGKADANGGWNVDVGQDIWGGAPANRDAPANRGAPEDNWGGAPDPSWFDPHADGGAGAGWGSGDAKWGVSEPGSHAIAVSRDSWHEEMMGRTSRSRRRQEEVPDRDTWTFVEKVAHKEEASAERRQRMHEFFEMPMERKVEVITDMIHLLQALPST